MRDYAAIAKNFYGGARYPLLVVALSFVGHVTGLDVAFIALILLSFVPAMILCDDFRFAAMPILGVVFTVSTKNYTPSDNGYAERFLNPVTLTLLVIVGALVIASLVFFLIRNRRQCNRGNWA